MTYRVVGFREYPFTERLSTVGRFMAYEELSFGTIAQRVLSMLGTRLHYGHPDFFDGFWSKTVGLSKANPRYHLNEDIFAGYEMMLRGEKVRVGVRVCARVCVCVCVMCVRVCVMCVCVMCVRVMCV